MIWIGSCIWYQTKEVAEHLLIMTFLAHCKELTSWPLPKTFCFVLRIKVHNFLLDINRNWILRKQIGWQSMTKTNLHDFIQIATKKQQYPNLQKMLLPLWGGTLGPYWVQAKNYCGHYNCRPCSALDGWYIKR